MTTISQAYHEQYLAQRDGGYAGWAEAYRNVVEKVKATDHETWITPTFQQWLWEDDSIAKLGPGNSVTVAGAYADLTLAEQLWRLRDWDRPEDPAARAKFLQGAFESILDLVSPKYNARRPSARLARLFCALFPEDTVCLLAHYMTGWVRRAFRIPKSGWDLIGQQVLFRERMRTELGLETSLQEHVERSQLAWFMVEQLRQKDDPDGEAGSLDDLSSEEPMAPKTSSARLPIRVLPIDVQSKGLSYIRQNLPLILGALRAAEHGATREDVIRQIMTDAPFLNRNSAQSAFTIVPRLGLIGLRDGAYFPTERGLALLDGEPPSDVITPVLIAKVFGVAHILNELRNAKGAISQAVLAERLQSYYPNWTTSFAPTALFQWLIALKLVESSPGSGGRRELSLTDAGYEWAASVPVDMSAWRVERGEFDAVSVADSEINVSGFEDEGVKVGKAALRAAPLEAVRGRFAALDLVGLDETVKLVHAALHALPHKRFVLLAGLSGTGKSALGRGYAQAYCEALGLPVDAHRLEIAVRPDWIDPGGLLGFFNPIGNPPGFQATKALQFLLAASTRSDEPFFLCLDEMNLARVEHYFAPLLSAMEGARLEIHAEAEVVDNVPGSIEWPKNLFIIGTVNMDESTHSFSDKVLDRAFVFEFWDVELERWLEARTARADQATLKRVFEVMKPIYDALYGARRHFGYRTLDEVLAFCCLADVNGADGPLLTAALDQAVFSKVLTKVRGDDLGGLAGALEAVAKICKHEGLGTSLKKVEAMTEALKASGAARFWA